ncbi:Putative cyclin-D6-1 [Linum grandiflorum]
MEFDLYNPVIVSETDPIMVLFSSESDHMTSSYSSVPYVEFRREAIFIVDSVWQADSADLFVPYLAINYMDRFASRLPSLEGKPWVASLVAGACLSLAAKMRNFDEFSLAGFKHIVCFTEETLGRMEAVILDALRWRMRSVTPFSFLRFFSSMLKPEGSAGPVTNRAGEIVFRAQHEFNLLEFKPSVVAASASLLACQELFPLQFLPFYTSICSSKLVNMDNLERCLNNMQGKVGGCGRTTIDAETDPSSILSWNSDVSEATASFDANDDALMNRQTIDIA